MKVDKGYKKTELGEIPEDWHFKTFGEVMKGFSSGQTPSRSVKNFYTGKIPWITSGELNYNVITDTIEKITTEAATKTHLKTIPVGTFLMAITGLEAEGTRGSCAITGVEATTNQSCMALYPDEKELTTEYLFQFYKMYGHLLAFKYCQGTKQQSYTGKIAKTLPIIIPPTIEEQNAITKALNETDAFIADLEKLIAKKQNIKQGTMQVLLTGKKRLKGFKGEWIQQRLPNVCWCQEGPGVRNKQFTTSGVKLLNGTNINKGKLNLDATDRYISEKEALGFYSHFLADDGDILIACSGITIDKFHEKVTIARAHHLPLCMNTSTMRFKVTSKKLVKEFLFYFLQSDSFKDQIGGKATGSAQLNFGPSHVKMVSINLPEPQEQTEISNILSDIDKEIEALQQQLSKYNLMKEGMMQNLLTGKVRLV